jgi:hypothetical protein
MNWEGYGKKAVLACFSLLSWNLPGEAEEKHGEI